MMDKRLKRNFKWPSMQMQCSIHNGTNEENIVFF